MILRTRKTDCVAKIYKSLSDHASHGADGMVDGMRMIQLLSGMLVETVLLFDNPDHGLEASYALLSDYMSCEPLDADIATYALPPSYILDYETESGRTIARTVFEDWLDCPNDFHDIVLFITHNILTRMECDGQPKPELFRLFIACTNRAMAYEVAAQELCDFMIEQKIETYEWSMVDGVSSLGAFSGRCLALSQDACELFKAPSIPDKLDQLTYVMTQEAIRLGVPAGTDWRFGLAANDCFTTAPFNLIDGIDPYCKMFFALMGLDDLVDQAVACAKAAGRMLALASGGDEPEIEPVIGKPLLMGAMTDTYKTLCQNSIAVNY